MRSWIWAVIAILAAYGCGSRAESPEVVVYTSVDQVIAEPVLKAFEEETGIVVRAVYDVEANKTTGLANRLIAEAPRPKADVFWNGEFVQTLRLKRENVLETYQSPSAASFPTELVDPDGYWTGMTPRLRVFISAGSFAPREIALDKLVDVDLPGGQIAISDPLFGTGSFQAAAYYSLYGVKGGGELYQGFADYGIRFEAGNSVVRDLVISGAVTLGVVDNDDACGAVKRGASVNVFLPTETLSIPSTVAIVKGARNRSSAEALVDFLLGPKAEAMLISAGWSEEGLHPNAPEGCLGLPSPTFLRVDPQAIADSLQEAHDDLQKRILR